MVLLLKLAAWGPVTAILEIWRAAVPVFVTVTDWVGVVDSAAVVKESAAVLREMPGDGAAGVPDEADSPDVAVLDELEAADEDVAPEEAAPPDELSALDGAVVPGPA